MIRIKKKSVILFMLLIVTLGQFIISTCELNHTLYYICDIFNVLLLICMVEESAFNNLERSTKIVLGYMGAFFLLSIISSIVNGVELILFLWGLRTIFRFFVFFCACVCYLEDKDICKLFNYSVLLFWINLFVTLIEKFCFGYSGDYLGGIFGVAQGVNTASIIFLNFVLLIILEEYFSKRKNLVYLLLFFVAYFVVSVFAELKINFILFAFVLCFEFVLHVRGNRKLAIKLLMIGLFGGLLGLLGLYFVYPDSYKVITDLQSANKYMDQDYIRRDIFTRNALFSVVYKHFFGNDFCLNLFGYGLGACEFSSFFSSAFYNEYGDFNYRNYSSAMLILQNGYLGFFLYLCILIQITKQAFRGIYNKVYSSDNKLTLVFSAIVFILIFYNTIFADIGYCIWIILAIPFIHNKSNGD